MKSTYSICSALLLAAAPVFAIPPEDFGFPSAPNDTVLSMSFTNNGVQTNVVPGALFGFGIAENAPLVALNTSEYSSVADYDGAYVLIMADPDASTPQNPTARWVWHWGQANLRKSDSPVSPQLLAPSPATDPIIPYARPMPPVTSDAHRYIFYLFEQPDNFAVPEAFTRFNADTRTNFNLTQMAEEANLGVPVAAQYFFVSHKEGVADDFVAAPGSEYPGGNGGAILAGPGPSATPSMSGSMTMSASMTGSMTASETGMMASATMEGGSMPSETAAPAGGSANSLGAGAGVAGLAAAIGAAILVAA